MKQVFIFCPKSKKTIWIFKSKISDKSRINICLKKLDRIYHEHIKSETEISTNKFYQLILKNTSHFKRESDRMKSVILKKTKSSVEYAGDCGEKFDVSINSQLSSLLYDLLQLFDELMCLAKTCFDLNIFQQRSIMYKKIEHYKKCLKRVIHDVCQHKLSTNAAVLI